MKLFSVFDNAAGSYDVPRAFPSKGVAIRSCMDALGVPDTVFAKWPENFSLFILGEFDPLTAKFDLLPAPELVANFWELKK